MADSDACGSNIAFAAASTADVASVDAAPNAAAANANSNAAAKTREGLLCQPLNMTKINYVGITTK